MNVGTNKMVVRIDSAVFKNAVRTPQGYLRMPLYATKTGVFTYRNPDGSLRRELRHPEDVFDQRSLATLANIPVTDDHPNAKNPKVMLIDASNTKNFILGYTGDQVSAEGDYVSGTATIFDQETIGLIESGKRELSCGYECEREEIPGIYNGEPYDVRQRNIVYNHLALVDKGRAGPNVRLRLDSADAVQVENNIQENPMEKIYINGVEYELSPSLASALNSEFAALKGQIKASEVRADKAEARCDTLSEELGKVKDQLNTRIDSVDPLTLKSALKNKLKVFRVAEKVLPTETIARLDDLDDKEIMIEVIKAEAPTAVLEGKSEHYIEARFDTIAEMLESSGSTAKMGHFSKSLTEGRLDRKEDSSWEAYLRQTERAKNQYKKISF